MPKSKNEMYGFEKGPSALTKRLERLSTLGRSFPGTAGIEFGAYDRCNQYLLKDLLADPRDYEPSGNAYSDLEEFSHRPWAFFGLSTGLLYSGIASGMRHLMTRYANATEPDINAQICSTVASHVLQLRWAVEEDDVAFESSASAFCASTGRREKLLGADFGLIAHAVIGERNRYVVALIQGKKMTTSGGTARVDRPDDDHLQLDRITSSGMGHYLFYHTDDGGDGHPYVPCTIRPADEIWDEVALNRPVDERLSKFSVGTFGRNLHKDLYGVDFGAGTAVDFALFAANLPTALSGAAVRVFSDPEAAVKTLLQQYEVADILNVTTNDGPGFENLLEANKKARLQVKDEKFFKIQAETLRHMKSTKQPKTSPAERDNTESKPKGRGGR